MHLKGGRGAFCAGGGGPSIYETCICRQPVLSDLFVGWMELWLLVGSCVHSKGLYSVNVCLSVVLRESFATEPKNPKPKGITG